MIHAYKIVGMTCNNCKATVEKKISEVPNILGIDINLDKGEAKIMMNKHVSTQELQAVLPDKFSITEKKIEPESQGNTLVQEEKSKLEQLKPLFLILFYISVTSVLMHNNNWDMGGMMVDFMGLFYIVFSFFKMLDLKGFANSFGMYDPLAKHIPFYAKIYPFIEVVLGLMFLMRFQVTIAIIISIVVLSITTIGVTKTLIDKKNIRCACLGTALKLPMTEATFLENAIMLIMGGSLLFSQIN